MKAVVNFFNIAQKAISESPADSKITWGHISTTMGDLIVRLTELKFVKPSVPPVEMQEIADKLTAEFEASFEALQE